MPFARVSIAVLNKSAVQIAALVVLMMVWELATNLFRVSPDKLPALSFVLATMWSGRVGLADAVWVTLSETLLGLFAGIVVGIAGGVVLSSVRLIERMLLPYFVASQAVPIIAFGAIIIMWFGNGVVSKAVIAFYLSFFPIAVNTLGGIRRIGDDEIGLLRTFGANPLTVLWKLKLPAALPPIFTAIRISVGLALVGAIVGEWFGASRGLGVVLLTAMFDNRVDQLWAGILLTGLTGTVLFWAVVALQKQIAWWHAES